MFWIYSVLHDADVMTEAHFTEIYHLSPTGRQHLVDFLCEVSPDKDTLPIILTMAARQSPFVKKMGQCLRFFKERDGLTPAALLLLESKGHEAHCLIRTLNALDRMDGLNEAAYASLTACESLYQVDELLDLLPRFNLTMTQELLDAIASSASLKYLVEILPVINPAKVNLTKDILIHLLGKDFKFFFVRKSVLKRLGEDGLLTTPIWHYVLKNDVFSLKQILDILAAASLLKDNGAVLNRIVSNTIDCYDLGGSIGYLQRAGLLTQQSLESCLQLLPKGPAPGPKRALLDLFRQLDEVGFSINASQLTTLFALSPANTLRLRHQVLRLVDYKLLNESSFTEALQRVSQKLPPVNDAVADKKSRKASGAARSQITVTDGPLFFTGHDKHCESGGFGKVKKGYPSLHAPEPVYSIKKLYEKDEQSAQKEAVREVKHHRLLGRQAFYYTRQGSTFIVADWQQGKALHRYSADELKKAPMQKRLACLRDALSQLNTLHAHARVHGDIKDQNVILDFHALSMKLIDFGGSHRQASRKSFAFTPAYADPRFKGDHYCRDMYAMGLVAMQLFPELFTVHVDALTVRVKTHKVRPTLIEQAVLDLIAAMMCDNVDTRCTSEAAFQYCDSLLTQDTLDRKGLETIKNTTIARCHKTVEDVLRM
ncbi:protein kinase family protein [Legionella taurinensis]|uniref:Protein kinase family protein n=1 Tax=Legionella taurinensis TaxID=70611 RepID=A0AB38N5X9_9GAMM|nr:protein kinase [Legionella taurinensis]MDX1837245.1 protein kinase [Legionella taurinensis]PUT40282.1 protein kinase family protein [Legionella taurinensis]PUT41516.1 protein kinase family protein [Legionella taurinensis]PUT44382.1 protein kinase family protein [Legionella taurinensis]PUT48344.1 protein kinase family protein [Legionella taurinensis]